MSQLYASQSSSADISMDDYDEEEEGDDDHGGGHGVRTRAFPHIRHVCLHPYHSYCNTVLYILVSTLSL